jgi:hypothetical protein
MNINNAANLLLVGLTGDTVLLAALLLQHT